MPLHYGDLFWPSTYSDPHRYPSLKMRKKTRAVIIGGGMSGVMCGYVLAKSGIDAILIEQNAIAAGSTSANTGLLQYSNDKMLSEFAEQLGEQDAVKFYRACKHASEQLNDIAEGLRRQVDFKRRSSLYYASSPMDVPALRREFELLHRNGFDAEWWEENRIAESFPFHKAAAIVTHGDAEVNPYLFVHALAEEASLSGLEIFENTAMLAIESTAEGYNVTTNDGKIEAKHIIYAVGYVPELAGGRWIRARINRSYAIVTEPLPSLAEWHQRFLLWETARPYLYLRTTMDNRIIVGGLDENIRQPVLTEPELHTRSMRLLSELHRMFPDLAPQIRYQWCAAFGESADGLPWIGEDPDRPGQYYCLGYGGNGTIYSMLGAEVIRDHLLGADNSVASIIRPDRDIVIAAQQA